MPIEITNSIGMKLVLIPSGDFLMGSPDWDTKTSLDEKPQHPVRITKPFYLGRYLVTQNEYQQVMGSNPSYFSATGDGKASVIDQDTKRLPVENVSWDQAADFCRKLSNLPAEKAAGRTYFLPSEAQWEYACRAGSTTTYFFGDNWWDLRQYAWFSLNAYYRTQPVGTKMPNAWGLYDIYGDVWEWCADWYGSNYYASSPTDDPTGPKEPPENRHRLRRGGSWESGECWSAERYPVNPAVCDKECGFRVSLVPAEK